MFVPLPIQGIFTLWISVWSAPVGIFLISAEKQFGRTICIPPVDWDILKPGKHQTIWARHSSGHNYMYLVGCHSHENQCNNGQLLFNVGGRTEHKSTISHMGPQTDSFDTIVTLHNWQFFECHSFIATIHVSVFISLPDWFAWGVQIYRRSLLRHILWTKECHGVLCSLRTLNEHLLL